MSKSASLTTLSGSVAMLLLFAAASLAQGNSSGKLSQALGEKGISISENLLAGATSDRSVTIRVKLSAATHSRNGRAARGEYAEAVDAKEHAGEIRVQRSLELSKYLLLCVAVDDSGKAVWLSTTPDPRSIRAEVPDESGVLTGREADNPNAEVLITIPANSAIRSIRLFHPEWDGESYVLTQIGEIKTSEVRPAR